MNSAKKVSLRRWEVEEKCFEGVWKMHVSGFLSVCCGLQEGRPINHSQSFIFNSSYNFTATGSGWGLNYLHKMELSKLSVFFVFLLKKKEKKASNVHINTCSYIHKYIHFGVGFLDVLKTNPKVFLTAYLYSIEHICSNLAPTCFSQNELFRYEFYHVIHTVRYS